VERDERGGVPGLALHIGARIMAETEPGEVLVSATVRDLVVGSGLQFAECGTRTLRGVPGTWPVFAVVAS
jgi:class 3 adenylate cyclase